MGHGADKHELFVGRKCQSQRKLERRKVSSCTKDNAAFWRAEAFIICKSSQLLAWSCYEGPQPGPASATNMAGRPRHAPDDVIETPVVSAQTGLFDPSEGSQNSHKTPHNPTKAEKSTQNPATKKPEGSTTEFCHDESLQADNSKSRQGCKL